MKEKGKNHLTEDKKKITNESTDSQETAIQDDIILKPDDIIHTPTDDTYNETKVCFEKRDLDNKSIREIDKIPDIDKEDLKSNDFSMLLKDVFPDKTKAEKFKINRRFLKDATPFNIKQLSIDLKNEFKSLITGFSELDKSICISANALNVITGMHKHGKTVFLLNIMLNMAKKYPELHFVYYTYEESKSEVEVKLINMSGNTYFSNNKKDLTTNLDRWKYELRTKDVNSIKGLSDKNPEYKGLFNFLQVSKRIHVVDSYYNNEDLLDSIKSFCNTFEIGAIFVDPYQKIALNHSAKVHNPEWNNKNIITERLSSLSRKTRVPIILSSRLSSRILSYTEYDMLTEKNMLISEDIIQEGGLIVGIQNYAKSKFLGSKKGNKFNSRFYKEPIETSKVTPEIFKTKKPETIMLVKILVNRYGPELEAELLFDRWLLKIKDLYPEAMQRIKTTNY